MPSAKNSCAGISGTVGERQDRQRTDADAAGGLGRARGWGAGRSCGQRQRDRLRGVVAAQRTAQRRGVGEPARGVLLQAARHDRRVGLRDRGAQRAQRRRRLVHDAVEQLAVVAAREGPRAGAHLVHDRAHRPDVRARVGALAADLLGRHVRQRAGQVPGGLRAAEARDRRAGRALEAREAEIQHLRPPARVQDDVAGLQVAVDDALLVRGLERLRHLERDRARSRLGQRSGLEQPRERVPGHVLEHEEVDAIVRIEVEQRGDVGMEEPRQRARLEPQLPAVLFAATRVGIGVQDLQRHVALEARIGGAIHASHAALAEPLDDPIAAERGPWPVHGGHAAQYRRALKRGRGRGASRASAIRGVQLLAMTSVVARA
jgi:hypothetical protein